MTPVNFPEANIVLGANQPPYEPLHAHHASDDPHGCVTCCFELTDAEIEELVLTRKLWMRQLTFNRPFQPIALSTRKTTL